MGFVDGGARSSGAAAEVVIGAHQMEDSLVEFDMEGGRLGFSSSVMLHGTMCANFNFTTNDRLVSPEARLAAGKPPGFPAVLAFGDSSVDTGNNNYIATPFRGDHPPYGRDFPGRVPTGRFSNGRLVPDILASLTGLKETVPPFLSPNLSDYEIATGVSFASAGSGLDDLTTSISGVIPVSRQPGYFQDYAIRLEGVLGKREARKVLEGALVVVSAGTNDFILNFYDFPTRRVRFSADKYQDFLQMKLREFVKELYILGCRKMVVSGLPPIGCLPIQMTVKSPILRACSHRENADAKSYNEKLMKLLPRMENELPGSKILYVDVYNPLMDIINNPEKYGKYM
ncbi:GDSL esterase/lipase [Striga hermonthica]|uniref:GDSL esterase/lipase n=1 Tax=Striga hermonthica TaxID=68872 RepID=A0A9N7NFZ8_STRHE|nr:GDSL esterase/lipase [Striga hermonthica]